jgi:trk system potassium uptake protein TrkA
MRIAIVGGGGLATTCARALIESGCEVVLIEKDGERIEQLRDTLDCGLLHGDGTSPAILREADPERCDALLCLAGSDHDNILASVVGRHLGFARTVTKIEDREYEPICVELGLGDTIVPDRTIARSLVDMVHGKTVLELSTLGSEVRLYNFVVAEAMPAAKLELPKRAIVIGVTRSDAFVFADELDGTQLEEDDQVFLLTHVDNVDALEERFGRKAG